MGTTRQYTTDEVRLIISMSSASTGGRDVEDVLRELRGSGREDESRVVRGDDEHPPVLSEEVHYVREGGAIRYTAAGLRAILQHLR